MNQRRHRNDRLELLGGGLMPETAFVEATGNVATDQFLTILFGFFERAGCLGGADTPATVESDAVQGDVEACQNSVTSMGARCLFCKCTDCREQSSAQFMPEPVSPRYSCLGMVGGCRPSTPPQWLGIDDSPAGDLENPRLHDVRMGSVSEVHFHFIPES